jgi:hypothetical protein
MSNRLEVLAFLQKTSANLHKLARDRDTPLSAEMLRIADEIARETAKLEADLIEAGLLDAGLASPTAANEA